jgi:ankyrin repeat protein
VLKYLFDVFRAHEVLSLWSGHHSPLHIAICSENVEVVNLLVSRAVLRRAVLGHAYPLSFLETNDGDGRTPLLFACTLTGENGHSVVRCLVQWERPNGLDAQLSQSRDRHGRTALHLACASHARLEQVTELLQNYDNDVEAQDSTKMRPLHVAVESAASQNGNAANLSIVRFLVTQARADVNAKDGKGCTPLHHACRGPSSHNTDLIRFLVGRGAATESGDTIGRTPLHVATLSDNLCIVAHLIEKEGTTVDLRDNYGNTSLYLACKSGYFAVARYLLNQQANADAENVRMLRPIHIACSNRRYDILRLLVERFDANVNATDKCGRTPLHKACMCNVGSTDPREGAEVVEFLLDNGANADARDEDGMTPLLHAVSLGDVERARSLLSSGASIFCTNTHQNNVLHVARTVDVAKLLIEDSSPSAIARGVAHSLLTSTNSRGETPIEIAHRRFLSAVNTDDRKMDHYILSFTKRQVAFVLPRNHKNNRNERQASDAFTQLNRNLSPLQRLYALRILNLLGRTELVEDLQFHILGFLSPLDLMNG